MNRSVLAIRKNIIWNNLRSLQTSFIGTFGLEAIWSSTNESAKRAIIAVDLENFILLIKILHSSLYHLDSYFIIPHRFTQHSHSLAMLHSTLPHIKHTLHLITHLHTCYFTSHAWVHITLHCRMPIYRLNMLVLIALQLILLSFNSFYCLEFFVAFRLQ